MEKSKVVEQAQENAVFISFADTLPNLSVLAKSMAGHIEEEFRSFDGIDILSAAVVLSVIGTVDTTACMEAFKLGTDIEDLKSTAMSAMAYLYAADSIFKSEGVLFTLEDHFAKGAKEGS